MALPTTALCWVRKRCDVVAHVFPRNFVVLDASLSFCFLLVRTLALATAVVCPYGTVDLSWLLRQPSKFAIMTKGEPPGTVNNVERNVGRCVGQCACIPALRVGVCGREWQ